MASATVWATASTRGARAGACGKALRLQKGVMVGLESARLRGGHKRQHLLLEPTQQSCLAHLSVTVELGHGEIEHGELIGSQGQQLPEWAMAHEPSLQARFIRFCSYVREPKLHVAHHALSRPTRAAEALLDVGEGDPGPMGPDHGGEFEELVGLGKGHAGWITKCMTGSDTPQP